MFLITRNIVSSKRSTTSMQATSMHSHKFFFIMKTLPLKEKTSVFNLPPAKLSYKLYRVLTNTPPLYSARKTLKVQRKITGISFHVEDLKRVVEKLIRVLKT